MENLIGFWITVCTVFALAVIFMCVCADIVKEEISMIIDKARFYRRMRKMVREGTWIQIEDKVYELVKNTHIEEV